MELPSSIVTAFNANLDHVLSIREQDMAKLEQHLPVLYKQMGESFSWGMQKEVTIDIRVCNFLLSSLKFERETIGGQAGNAAQQASALGVKCFLHSNVANEQLLRHFSHSEKIMVANESGFVRAQGFSSQVASAHHFVFESPQAGTRFIASYDPVQLHLEDNFEHSIGKELPGIAKAFTGGFHLIKTPERLRKLIEEMKRWKEINPKLQIFCELGEFQNPAVMAVARQELLPFVDMVGLNDTELSAFGVELEEIASETQSLLFHTPEMQKVLPEKKLNPAALEFAKKCASFKAKNGKFATLSDLTGATADFVDSPTETVGLGDTLSSAYFLADSPRS